MSRLSNYDYTELHGVIDDLCYYVSQAEIFGLTHCIVDRMRVYLSNFQLMVGFHCDVSPIPNLITKFYYLIWDFKDSLLELTHLQVKMIISFVCDLRRWAMNAHTNECSPELNSSLLSDYASIDMMLRGGEPEETEIEFF